MRRILYISMCLPFDKAFHAGGKTFNYYIKKFANDPDNEVTLIAKVLPEEENYIDTINPRIHKLLVRTPKEKIRRYLGYIKSINSKFNPFYKYGNVISKEIYDQIEDRLKELKHYNYHPEVVVLEWTSMLLYIDVVKKFFPDAKYVASEHDVSFLGMKRQISKAKNPFERNIKTKAYYIFKRNELEAIQKCDLVVTHNNKDKRLLINNGIPENKLGVIVPYYDRFPAKARYNKNKKDIIYYGAMNRMENSTSAMWFIENVMPALGDCDVRFVIIGNKPPKELVNRANDRIIVTGFVEDPSDYFNNAMCLAAPLLYGAGIKVKIIEALSSGVPVLTNSIGIEGIDAEDGISYFHCESASDYVNTIKRILEKKIDIEAISRNAIELINKNYDLERSYIKYSERIYSLL